MRTLSQNWQNWVIAALAATWLAAQNVGIGTTTPLTRLHVAAGDIFLGDAAGANGFVLHSRSSAGYDYFQISTRTGGTYEWSKGITLVRSSGYVGIGTTDPAEILTVEPYTSFPSANITPSNTGIFPFGTSKIALSSERGIYLLDNTDFIGLALKNEGNDRKDGVIYWGDNPNADNLRFMFALWNGVTMTLYDRMIITSNGDVGIGTTSPAYRLHVAGDIRATGSAYIDGNVGIGTTSPTHKVHVSGDIRATGSAYIAGNVGIGLLTPGQKLHVVGNAYIDGWLQAINYIRSNGNIIVDGNAGIGTTSPAYRLHVVGAVYATGLVYCNGNPVCSDQRWKTNIKPIQNALDNLLKMQGVTYYWKADEYPDKHFPEGEQVGFIAQEIEKVYPQVVFTDKDGYKSVDYSKLTPVLVEAIKEQQKIIEELQRAIQQLQEENSQIKQTNAQLSAEIKMLNEKVDNLINSLSNDKKLGYR